MSPFLFSYYGCRVLVGVWEISPGPFELLTDRERDVYISYWVRWLQALSRPAWIHVFSEPSTLKVGGEEFEYIATRFFVEADERDDPSSIFNAVRSELPERRPIVRVYASRLRLTGGVWARVYVVYKLPKTLPEGFLSELYGVVAEVHLYVEPRDPAKTVRKLELQRRRLGGLARLYGNVELMDMYTSVEALLREAMGYGRLFNIVLLLIITGDSPSGLKDRCDMLEGVLKSRMLEYQAPLGVQAKLYNLDVKLVTPLIIGSSSAVVFYPFILEELWHAGGFFIGWNKITGAPIVFNPYRMSNYNVVVLGETGSGKSMTAKVYIRRFWRNFGYPVYIVDPEGEYGRIADKLVPGIRVYGSRGSYGLDPVRLAKMGLLSFDTAVDVIAEYYSVPPELRGELIRLFMKSSSITEVYEKAGGELRKYMEPVVSIDKQIYEGDPPDPGDRGAVFDLSCIESKQKKVLIGGLLAGFLMGRLKSKALLVVDEGWMFTQFPSLMQLLADISRRGRKRGVNFLFLTQRPHDVLKNESGRTILEQSATVLILRLGEASLEAIRGIYNLSEAEEQTLLEAKPGEGVLRAGSYKLSVYIQPTRDELREFSTRPV